MLLAEATSVLAGRSVILFRRQPRSTARAGDVPSMGGAAAAVVGLTDITSFKN
jgi:hypothetical protein